MGRKHGNNVRVIVVSVEGTNKNMKAKSLVWGWVITKHIVSEISKNVSLNSSQFNSTPWLSLDEAGHIRFSKIKMKKKKKIGLPPK